jgi:hypothetical protein
LPRPQLPGGPKPPRTPSYGIGDRDAHVFNCPVCARPLPDGTWECPGCSTHLIFGVTFRRAGGLLAFGAVVGILFGGIAMSLAIGLGLPSGTTAGNGIVGNTSTNGSPKPSLAPGAGPVVTAPKAALAAMRQIALLDERMAADGKTLKAAVKANRTADIARALRTLGADASVGAKYLTGLGTWPDAADIAVSREAFYASVASTSRAGLTKSLSNKKGYKASGKAVLTILKKMPKLDAAARELAVSAGADLPVVDLAAIK